MLDPFAGSGTVGRVALKMGRRFFLIDNEPKYFQTMRREIGLASKTMKQEVLFEPDELTDLVERGQSELF